MRVHMAGKQGDLIYSLPVIKALARQHGKITLVTSALCYGLVPLLWEQPYLADTEMDYSRSYKMEAGSVVPWNVLSPEEGINLSPQPSMYRPNAPVQWTHAYAEIAGVKKLEPRDKIALPTLWNHRQWYWEHVVKAGSGKPWAPPKTAVLAPESETLKTIPLSYWKKLALRLAPHFDAVFVVGTRPDDTFERIPAVRDLRGLTTVSSMARLLAEAHVVICANSLPWHLARHAGTPTLCWQDQYLERCVPVDTPYAFYTAGQLEDVVKDAASLAEHPRTTLMHPHDLKELEAA